MDPESARNDALSHSWLLRLRRRSLLASLERSQARLWGISGGQWNGRVAPPLPELLAEVWGWRGLILEVAFQKTIARYRSFVLGPIWIILGFALFTFGLAALWSALQHIPFGIFLTYVSVGLFAWNIVLGALVDGCRCFQENRNLIQQSKAPLLVYPLVTMVKHIFMAAHHLIVVVPVLLFFNPAFDLQVLWLVPGVICLSTFCMSVCVMLAVFGAYLPDLAEVISSLLRFAFFFTPIFWMPTARPDMHLVWLLNPFYYAVESVRGPLLHTSDPAFVISVMAALAIAALVAASVTFAGWSRDARTRI